MIKKVLFCSFLLPLLGCNDVNKNNVHEHEIYLKAYPDHIAHVTDAAIVWKDGTEMLVSDGKENQKTFLEKLNNASLSDQISLPYITGSLANIDQDKRQKLDPGRFRNDAFFLKMYGTTKEEVAKHLVEIEWMPKSFKESKGTPKYKLHVTTINGVAEKLKKISEELDNLCSSSRDYEKFLENPGGTFNWRVIAGTNRPSGHSFGMTIDINVAHSNYWQWDYKTECKNVGKVIPDSLKEEDIDYDIFPAYRNQIPWEIIRIFEQNNFIWGGKWYHYDTMHFEYRPELFPAHFKD